MKLLNTLLLFPILLLSNCDGLGSNMAPRAIEPVNYEGEYESSSMNFNNRYLALLDIVERMRVFTEEEANLAPPVLDTFTEQEKEDFLEVLKTARVTQSNLIECLYNETLSLLQRKTNIDEYLSFLLEQRYTYLQNRQDGIQQTLAASSSQAASTLPTSKYLFDFLMEDKRFSKYLSFNELARTYAVSRFELLNLLIKESFSKCTLYELKPNTINLLRASVHLHPILTGERPDLGHPDEAGGYYAILEPIVKGSNNKKGTLNTEKLEELLKSKTMYNLAKKFNQNNPHITFLKTLVETINSANGKDSPITQEILHIKNSIDLAIYEGHYIYKEHFLPFKNLGTPTGPTHGVNIATTDYGVSKWPYELPNPEFLKNPPVCELADNNSSFEALENKREDKKEEKREDKIHSRRARTGTNRVEMFSKAQSVEVKVDQEVKEFQEATQQSSAWLKEELLEEEEIKEPSMEDLQPTSLIVSEPASTFFFTRDWELPQGLRSFHSQMLKYTYQVRELNGKHQHIVNQLFDPKQQCNVCFREFKNLWEAANGQIIGNHSGSHQELIGPQQEKLFGIFAHTNNQTYGKSYLRYLQTAVLYVGLRPTQGLEKLVIKD